MLSNLIEHINRGIIDYPKPKPACPGLAINEYLLSNDVSREDLYEIAKAFTQQIPPKHRGSHSHFALCLRNFFGAPDCGIFNQHFNTQINQWSKIFEFTEVLIEEFIKQNNFYALSLLYEIVGHRYGDMFLTGDAESEARMINSYHIAAFYGLRNESAKHIATPYYWAATYFFSKRDIPQYEEQSLSYYKKYIELIDTYNIPDLPPGEQRKVMQALARIRHFLGDEGWTDYLNDWLQKVKSSALESTLSEYRVYLYGYSDDPKNDYRPSRDYYNLLEKYYFRFHDRNNFTESEIVKSRAQAKISQKFIDILMTDVYKYKTVCCILIKNDEIVARAHYCRKGNWHAEYLVLFKACKKLHNDLTDCILYICADNGPCPKCQLLLSLANLKHIFILDFPDSVRERSRAERDYEMPKILQNNNFKKRF